MNVRLFSPVPVDKWACDSIEARVRRQGDADVEEVEIRRLTELTVLRMRRSLRGLIDQPVWPNGVNLRAFSESQAPEVHALFQLAYANGGGSVASFGEWWPELVGDSEYDANLIFPAYDSVGTIVGVAHCWTSAFVKDFAVHPRFRRRGLGRALLLHVFQVFRERGDEAVDLKVQANNPSGAVHFYEKLGMAIVSNRPTARDSPL